MDTAHDVLLLIGVLTLALLADLLVIVLLWRSIRKNATKEWRVFASSGRGMEGGTVDEIYPPELAAMFKDHFAQKHPEAIAFGLGDDGHWHKFPIGGDPNSEDEEAPESEEHPQE